MAYTVKKLSKLSGVTVRTLHFYDELGLLKPCYTGSNGYRYYEEKELLQLQQILFFKELGFSLAQIGKVLGRSDFDQVAALHSHRKALTQERERTGQLIETIDNTIKHLKREKKMKEENFFNGFTLVKINSENAAEAIVLKNLRESDPKKKRDKEFYERVNKTAGAILSKITSCLEKGVDPASDEVQKHIKRHHASAEEFHIATKEVYKALAELYLNHPDYRKQLDPFHPRLAEFMAESMKVFAERELT